MHRALVITAVAAVAMLAPACGEKDEETTATSPSRLTKAVFVREANRICKREFDKVERAAKQFFADAPAGKEAPPSELEEFGSKTVYPALQSVIDRIRALGAPSGEEAQVNEYLDAFQSGLDELKQDPQQIAQGGAAPAFEKSDKLAGELGLDDCVRV